MNPFTVLHISDVHFGVKDPKNEQTKITDELIKAAHDEINPHPDICIFSGDMTQQADDKDFLKCEKWLKKLINHWQPCPIFIVPGNHEVQRNYSDKLIIRAAHHTEDYFQQWHERKMDLTHLEAFFKWHKRAKDNGLPLISNWDSSELVCSVDETIRGGKIKLLGLNTAAFSCADDDEGKLVVDVGLVNKYLQGIDQKNEFVIAIGHHPLESLVNWNKKEIQTLFSQITGAHVYLHGHLHTEQANSYSEYGNNLTTLAAGASYQGSKYPQSFAFYNFDFMGQKIDPITYCYNHKLGLWVRNNSLCYPVKSNLPTINLRPRDDNKSNLMPPRQDVTSEINIIDEIKSSQVQNDIYMVISRNVDIISRINFKNDIWFAKVLDDMKSTPDKKSIHVISYSPIGYINIVEYLLKIVQPNSTIPSIFSQGTARKIDVFCLPETQNSWIFKSLNKIINKNNITDIPYDTVIKDPGYFSFCLTMEFKEFSSNDSNTKKSSIDINVVSAIEYLWKDMSSALHKDVRKGYLDINDFPRRLNFLRRLFDSCNEYLEDIHEQRPPSIASTSPLIEDKGSSPLESSQTTLSRLKNIIPPEYYNKMDIAYELRDRAETIIGTSEANKRFVAAANAFSSVLIDATDFINNNGIGEELSYWTDMEQAYCLLKSGAEENITRAGNIYNSILNKNPSDVVALYRSAQLLLLQNCFIESIDKFKQGLDMLIKGKDGHIKNNHWIHGHIERHLAITYWRLSEKCIKTKDTLENIHLAISYSRLALNNITDNDKRKLILNDLVYYGWSERNLSSDNTKYGLSKHEMNTLVDELREIIDIENITHCFPLDTLCKVFDLRNESENAIKVAKRIRELLNKKSNGNVIKNLNKDDLEAYVFASDVLAKHHHS